MAAGALRRAFYYIAMSVLGEGNKISCCWLQLCLLIILLHERAVANCLLHQSQLKANATYYTRRGLRLCRRALAVKLQARTKLCEKSGGSLLTLVFSFYDRFLLNTHSK
jgi:hypothetical protein